MSVLDNKKGGIVQLRNNQLSFSNPQAKTLISGPNEQFLAAIHSAFKTDACYVRYGADIHRTYEHFIIFTIEGLPKHQSDEFVNWISYLRVHQSPKNDAEFHLL